MAWQYDPNGQSLEMALRQTGVFEEIRTIRWQKSWKSSKRRARELRCDHLLATRVEGYNQKSKANWKAWVFGLGLTLTTLVGGTFYVMAARCFTMEMTVNLNVTLFDVRRDRLLFKKRYTGSGYLTHTISRATSGLNELTLVTIRRALNVVYRRAIVDVYGAFRRIVPAMPPAKPPPRPPSKAPSG